MANTPALKSNHVFLHYQAFKAPTRLACLLARLFLPCKPCPFVPAQPHAAQHRGLEPLHMLSPSFGWVSKSANPVELCRLMSRCTAQGPGVAARADLARGAADGRACLAGGTAARDRTQVTARRNSMRRDALLMALLRPAAPVEECVASRDSQYARPAALPSMGMHRLEASIVSCKDQQLRSRSAWQAGCTVCAACGAATHVRASMGSLLCMWKVCSDHTNSTRR